MTLRTRIIRLEQSSRHRITLTDLHARLGIVNGVPDRADPVQALIKAVGSGSNDVATLSAYVDALEAFGRGDA